jgi:hypothetical protein
MGHVEGVGEVSDLEMMKHPSFWPDFVLPLKQPEWRTAVLTASLDDEHYRLYEDVTLFTDLSGKEFIPLERHELQQVIDRGWRVD